MVAYSCLGRLLVQYLVWVGSMVGLRARGHGRVVGVWTMADDLGLRWAKGVDVVGAVFVCVCWSRRLDR